MASQEITIILMTPVKLHVQVLNIMQHIIQDSRFIDMAHNSAKHC